MQQRSTVASGTCTFPRTTTQGAGCLQFSLLRATALPQLVSWPCAAGSLEALAS